jgi:hypothetical protein
MAIRSHHTGLAVIAVFKVVKGALLLLVGLGLLKLMHAEIATLFSLLIEALHLNADSRFIHTLVLKVDALQPNSVLLAGLIRDLVDRRCWAVAGVHLGCVPDGGLNGSIASIRNLRGRQTDVDASNRRTAAESVHCGVSY